MKKNEVKIGGTYVAKVSDRLVSVRIDSAHSRGGLNATNTATNKRIHIKTAQRLRGPADAKPKAAGTKDAKKSTGKPATKASKTDAKPKRVSALDAAATVLRKADKPMRSQEMITAMADQGLWSSPAGKTPHATLYAAIVREIRKVDPFVKTPIVFGRRDTSVWRRMGGTETINPHRHGGRRCFAGRIAKPRSVLSTYSCHPRSDPTWRPSTGRARFGGRRCRCC